MKLENKTDNSCPYCRAEAKTGMIANSFWICGNATTHENRRSELCREREAHNKTKRERDELLKEHSTLREIAEGAIMCASLWAGSRSSTPRKLRDQLNQIK